MKRKLEAQRSHVNESPLETKSMDRKSTHHNTPLESKYKFTCESQVKKPQLTTSTTPDLSRLRRQDFVQKSRVSQTRKPAAYFINKKNLLPTDTASPSHIEKC